MKFYLKETVLEAAIERIRWLFDEFENIVVGFSGGKDSTVALNLTLKVAEERGRLPLKVLFVDQEAEWQTVVDYVRDVMNDPRVDPAWLQVPIRIFNGTSGDQQWLQCWEPGAEWMRPKEPNSVHENVYGTDRFGEMFTAFMRHHWPDAPVCLIGGVRADESPVRHRALTTSPTHKHATWGAVRDSKRRHVTMYPLYDWSTSDIWKAIHEHGWPYCSIYDAMWQHGYELRDMRVSNLHHETAVMHLFALQEIEGGTWERLSKRLKGVSSAKHLKTDFFIPDKLPPMFTSWAEYRDHLVENLAPEEHRPYYRRTFKKDDERFLPHVHLKLHRIHIQCVLVNDYHGSKLANSYMNFGKTDYRPGAV
ncbi:MAG: phosphoadenosine phosphosulfate reductase family protein, partial [Hyphomicrobiaceae bacterium]